MSRTMKIEVFQFDELSEEAKENARDWWREGGLNYEWWEFVYEDIKKIGSLMGVSIEEIFFSGFCSQGDGACFEGGYEYKRNGVAAISEYAPKDIEIKEIVQTFKEVQQSTFYSLSAKIKHSGRYYHSGCTDISVYDDRDYYEPTEDQEEAIKQCLRDFMDWIYDRLEIEYEWLISDESINENIRANGYEFLKDGSLA